MFPVKKIGLLLLGCFFISSFSFVSPVIGSPTLSASPGVIDYGPAPKVSVSYSGAPGNQEDWIGLFKVGAAERAFISYQYLKGSKSGTLSFTLPEEVGSYEFRMWEKEYTRMIGVSNPVKMIYGKVFLEVSPTELTIGPGKKLKATYSGAPGFDVDWVGLFVVGAPPRTYLSYIYTKGQKSGMMEFNAPENPGNYEMRFWARESVAQLASSKVIVIKWGEPQLDFSLSPKDASGNRKITVNYKGAPGYPDDWIGLFKVGAGERAWVSYQYLKGKTSGTLLFDCPKEKGPYEFRIWGNEYRKYLGKTQSFDIDGSTQPGKSGFILKAYPGDGKVFLEWSGAENQGNIIGYNLYRKSSTEIYKTPITDFPIKSQSYLDPNVENGDTVCYYAKVVYKGNREEGQSNEVCVVPNRPKIIVSFPGNGTSTNEKYTFMGKVSPGSSVVVNGTPVMVNPDGSFSATVTLKPGSNIIKIVATAKTGDVTTYEQIVTYNKPQPSGTIVIILKINQMTALVNNVVKTLDVAPFIDRGRTFVPFRFIGESLGAEISFTTDGSRVKTVSYKLGSVSIILTIGSKIAVVNGKSMTVDVPPQIIQGRTVVPLRFVTEALGCQVEWDGEEMKITIRYKG